MHGRKGTVSIDSGAVGRITAWSYEETAAEADATAMGDDTAASEGGIVSGSGQVDCLFDEVDTGQIALQTALRAGSVVTLTLVPHSVDSTKDLEAEDAIIKSFSINSAKDDVISCSFGFNAVLDLAVIA